MMGTKARLFTPIAAVSLDELVPADHFYRHLDRVLDLSFVRDLVQDCYAAGVGRPSVDPVVFFRLQLVLFFDGMRSERQLLRLAADRLSVRWFLGFNLDEPLPDHSSLTRIRARYGLAVFRRFFEVIVEQCQQAGLVWGKELYFDATQVFADAARDSLTPRFAVDAREARKAQARKAVEAHLEALFADGQAQPTQEEEQPNCDGAGDLPSASAAGTDGDAAHGEADGAAASAASSALSDPPREPTPLPVALSEEVREDLAAATAERHDWIAQGGQQQRDQPHGTYQRVANFLVSTTDPDATLMPVKGGGKHLGYHVHYVVDGGKPRIITQVLVTPSEVMENQPMLDLLWRVQFRHHLWPHQITGDTTYGTLEIIKVVEDAGIRAYVPLADFDHRTPYFGADRFRYDAEHDRYVCPAGAILRLKTQRHTMRDKRYRAPPATCNACPLKAQCTSSSHGRQLTRPLDEQYLDRVRAYHQTEAYRKAMRKRQVWVEPLFAEAKDWHGLRRFRLRRLWRVNCEALLIAAGQNLKRLLAKRGWGRRPLPSGAATAVKRFYVAVLYVLKVMILDDTRHWSGHAAPRIRQAHIAA